MEPTARRLPLRFQLLVVGALCLLGGLAAAPASAYPGDWTLGGTFERTTAPSFTGGFNPDDIDRIDVAFDNRAKQLSLTLTTFEAPSRGGVDIAFGNVQADGTCALGALDIAITTSEVLTERTISETVWEWLPPQERRTWSNTWPGTGWAFAGYDSWSRMYRWIKPGSWVPRTVQRTIVEPDALRVTRTATLEREGVGGLLVDTVLTDAGSLTTRWTFAAPQLDGNTADCLEILIPHRREPFTLASPPPVLPPAPLPPAAPAGPVDDADPDAIELEPVVVTAVRRGATIELLLRGGEAETIGVRARHGSRTLPFRRRVVLRNQPSTVRAVLVRLSDGDTWAPWERIRVR
jgi:hypothetical protein